MREAEAPHRRLSIMPSAAIVTMGESRSLTIEKLSDERSSRSASSSVRGMSPTVARESIWNTPATMAAAMMPTSEPGTRAPHFFGQTTMTATTSSPMSAACQFTWKPSRP